MLRVCVGLSPSWPLFAFGDLFLFVFPASDSRGGGKKETRRNQMPREYLCAFCLREDQRAEDLEDEKEASFEGLPFDLQKRFLHMVRSE